MSWTTLCNLSDLQPDKGKYVEVDGYRLAVFLNGSQVYVIDDVCPHAGGSLAAGPVLDGCAVCPWHGWAFKLETGRMNGSELITIGTYQVRLVPRDDDQLVQANLPMP